MAVIGIGTLSLVFSLVASLMNIEKEPPCLLANARLHANDAPRKRNFAIAARGPTARTDPGQEKVECFSCSLAYRMHSLGLLSDWQYRSLFIEITQKGYRKSEPESLQRETSQVLVKVFGRLREGGIPIAEVARQLGIYADELNKVIFGLVLTTVRGRWQEFKSPRRRSAGPAAG